MKDSHEIAAPVAKAATAWAAVGITSWAEFASFLAAVYSALLIAEWCWKRFLRDFAKRRGWLK
jgi:hypothetical protein